MLDNKNNKLTIFVSHPIHYIIGLAKELQKNGIDVTMYFYSDFGIRAGVDKTFGKRVKWYDESILDGLRHRFLLNASPIRTIGGFFSAINFGVIPIIVKNRHSPVLVYGWHFLSNWIVLVTCFVARVPVVMRGESPFNQELSKAKWKLWLKSIVLNHLFKRISAFLYIGEENRKFYKYYGVPDERLFFVPYAVDNEKFMKVATELKPKRKELRRKLLDIESGVTVILLLGKLIEKKRPMDLLRAYELFTVRHSPRTHLIFVGDGPLRPELEDYVKDHNIKDVHFAGFKNQTEIPEYYAIADIFVLPSGIGETWGLVVNEAMCFGLPILVSEMVGCGPDLVKDGENGFIFSVGDFSELADKLWGVLESGKKMEKFGKSSLSIIKDYSYSEDVKGIKEALLFCASYK